jgi:hypothetical protein
MNSIHTLQDTVFQKMFLPSFSSINQLRQYCWQLDNKYKLGKDIDYNLIEDPKTKHVCFRNRKYYFKRFLELTGYDVSDIKTDFVNIYIELKTMSTDLEYNKNPKYISPKPIKPENITRITMTEELLEICRNKASFELREFLIKNGLDIKQKEKLKKLSELKQEVIMDTVPMDTATIITPRF